MTEDFIPVIEVNGQKMFLSTAPYNAEGAGLRFVKNFQVQTARLYDTAASNSTSLRIKLNNKIFSLGTMPDGLISASCNSNSNSDKNRSYIFELKNNHLRLLSAVPVHINRIGYIPNFHLYLISYQVHASGKNWTAINYGVGISFNGSDWTFFDNGGTLRYILFGRERLWLLGNRYNSIKRKNEDVIFECRDDKIYEMTTVSEDNTSTSRYSFIGFDFNLNFYYQDPATYTNYLFKISRTAAGQYYLRNAGAADGQECSLAANSTYQISNVTNATETAYKKTKKFSSLLTGREFLLTGLNSDVINISGSNINENASVYPNGAYNVAVAEVTLNSYKLGAGG